MKQGGMKNAGSKGGKGGGVASSVSTAKQAKITSFFSSTGVNVPPSQQSNQRNQTTSSKPKLTIISALSSSADPPITITLSSDSDTPATPAKEKGRNRKKKSRKGAKISGNDSSSDEYEPSERTTSPPKRRRILFRTKSAPAAALGKAEEKQRKLKEGRKKIVVEVLDSCSPSPPEKGATTSRSTDVITEKTEPLPRANETIGSSASEKPGFVGKESTSKEKHSQGTKGIKHNSNDASEPLLQSGSETDFSEGNDDNNDFVKPTVKTKQIQQPSIENTKDLRISTSEKENGLHEAEMIGVDKEPEDDEDAILSSMDIDEVVKFASSSPSQKPTLQIGLSQSSLVSPSPIRKSPLSASPKPKATYFSPVRHVVKRKEPNKKLFGSPVQPPSATTGPSSLPVRPPPVETVHSNTSFDVLENFLIILNTVTTDSHSINLFNEDDLYLAAKFRELSSPAQNLYIRLFKRTLVWYRQSKVVYNKIALDLEPAFLSLHQSGLFTEIKDEEGVLLEVLLDLLNKDEMLDLAVKMKLKVASTNSRSNNLEALLKMTQTQRTLSKRTASQVLTDAVLQIIGPTFRISEKSKDLFNRVFILYSLPQYWDDETHLGANQLLTMLLSKLGNMDYPDYIVTKVTQIYRSRDDLIRFREALALHSSIQGQIESKEWAEAVNILELALEKFKETLSDASVWQHDKLLKSFLRAYTAGSVLARTVWLGVDAHQKLKQYSKANELIDFLLSQTESNYLAHYRGRLHERKIINSKHLKETIVEVKGHIIKGLSDSLFIGDHMLMEFSARLIKIHQEEKKKKEAVANKKKKRAKRDQSDDSSDESKSENPTPSSAIDELKKLHPNLRTFTLTQIVPERSVEAEQLRVGGLGERMYGKSTFLGEGNSPGGSGTVSSVEQRALAHYQRLGYPCGAHGESSIPVSLFGLVFWDVIYCSSIPDAFRGPFQAYPLDLHFEDFYLQRKILIDEMLHNLRYSWSLSDAYTVIAKNWDENVNKLSIVIWDSLGSFENVKKLVKVMGLKLLADICERFAQNFRYYRSGFPDLMVWNENEIIFVEVKGPGDKLSAKQSIWLDYLLSVGAKAEVCRVKSVSNKRIRV